MTWWNAFVSWLRSTLHRKRTEAEMVSELSFHISAYADDLERSGLSREEAMRQARLEFGAIEAAKEECREARGIVFLDRLIQDLRYAARSLRKSPGFTAVAVLTLALGIGATTAIFSVVNSVLLQPLPFHDPGRLVRIFGERGTAANLPVSGEDYFDWQSQTNSFAAMSLFSALGDFNASGAGDPETISVVSTEANFFSVLGVQAERGRVFAQGEDQSGNNHVAVLSHGFWQRHFGGRDAIGKSVTLNFQPYTVVGVMSQRFNYPESVDAWIPLEMSLNYLGRRGNYSYKVVARLKPDATLAQARADLATVTKRQATLDPINNANLGARVLPMKEFLTGDSRPQLLVLLGAVLMVLLVACTNVANLLLVRATGRQREIALRGILGASRWRIVRQLLTESVALSCAGAAVGILAAWSAVRLAQSARSLPIPRENPIQLDGGVLLFAIGLTVLVGILFGLAPALQGSRTDLNEQLKSSAASLMGASTRRAALRNGLVIAEIGASLALMAGAALLLKTFQKMRAADLGVRTENIVTAAVVLPETKYKSIPQRREFYDRLLEKVQSVPGVTAAAIAQQIPLEGSHGGTAKLAEDPRPWSQALAVNWNFVTPDYFRLYQVPFLSGRTFASTEINRATEVGQSLQEYWQHGNGSITTPQPQFASFAVINHAMAESLWPGQDPVGKVFISAVIQPVTVVGVVGDEKYSGIREAASPEVYFPLTLELTNHFYPAEIVVRSKAENAGVIAGIRSELHELDGELSLFRVRNMEQVISDNMQDTSLQTVLIGSFAGLGLLLSTLGIYGVMAYMVTQRTHEIGLRLALGAHRAGIVGMVLGRGAKLAFAGIIVGLIAALGLTRLLSAELFGVTASDPVTFVEVAILLILVSLLACYLPARRAMRVDPMVALRYE